MSKPKKCKSNKSNKVLMRYVCKRFTNKTTGEVEAEYVNVGGVWYGFTGGFGGRYSTAHFLTTGFAPIASWDAVNHARPNCKVTKFIVQQ